MPLEIKDTVICRHIFVEFDLDFFKINMKQEYKLQNYVVVSLFPFDINFVLRVVLEVTSSLTCDKNGVSILIKL